MRQLPHATAVKGTSMRDTGDRLISAAGLFGATLVLAAGAAYAQDSQSGDDPTATEPRSDRRSYVAEEIVVGARKRDETLMQVAVAVSVLGTSDISRYAATDLSKIGQLIPQVLIAKTGGGGGGASLAIRGVGSSALDAGIDQ